MAEISLPANDGNSKRTIEDAIVYQNLDGRRFASGSSIKVYFMPEVSGTSPAFKPYTEQQIAQANESDRPGMTNLNATYQGIRPQDRQNVMENVFGVWSKMADISFEETTDPAEAQIRVGAGTWSDNASVNVAGLSVGSRINSVFIRTDRYNPGTDSAQQFAVGSRQTHELIHEVGHAIGLNHPTIDQTGGVLPAAFNRMWFNVMTNFGPTTAGWGPTTPSLFDAVGLEALYGLRSLNETDNYVIAPDTGRLIVDNGEGVDTINASATNTRNEIDLRATDFAAGKAYFSSIGLNSSFEPRYNVAIYEGTKIENAKGGSGADTIIGNDLDNRLEGGLGSDKLEGGLGTDTYRFVKAGNPGWGADIITDNGGQGRILVADSAEQEGVQLVGGKNPNNLIKSAWFSDDKKYMYRFIPKVPGGTPGTTSGTVIITRNGESVQNESITVQNWSQGQLGITLGTEAARPVLPNEIKVASGDLVPPDTITYSNGEVRYQQEVATVAAPDNDDVMYSADYRSAPLVQSANLMSAAMSTPDYKRVELHGLGGNDVLWGDAGQDLLDGGAGNDLLVGGQGLNSLIGGEGNDVILTAFTPIGGGPDPRWGPNDDWTAPAGASSVIAEGANWGVYTDANGEMHISMLNSFYRPGAAEGSPAYHRVNDMDHVWWSAYPEGVDPLDISHESWVTETDAGGGNDMVIGGLNADIIRLGEGNDIAFGNIGHDDIDGGEGDDRIYGDTVVFSLVGASFHGYVTGDDILRGGGGADLMVGGLGSDTLEGGDGADLLLGDVANNDAPQYETDIDMFGQSPAVTAREIYDYADYRDGGGKSIRYKNSSAGCPGEERNRQIRLKNFRCSTAKAYLRMMS